MTEEVHDNVGGVHAWRDAGEKVRFFCLFVDVRMTKGPKVKDSREAMSSKSSLCV